MKLNRKWLNEEFVDLSNVSDKEFVETLTVFGQKVETWERLDAEIKNVVVGKVLSMVRHPNSDHMWICQVDVGSDAPVQIVTGAQNVHVQMVVNVPGVGAVHHRLVVTHGLAEGGGSFPGKADDAVAVGTVVGDLKIHNGVVVADDEVDVLTDGALLVVENPDAVGEHAGQVVLGQTQLGEGAEHTVGRFAPELALGDVNAAGEP